MHLATMKRCVLFLMAIFGFTALSLAQTVTGKVTDKKGEPLPGVTVTVKGTKNATSTNNSGVYTLSNVGADAVLVFTGAGIAKQEAQVSGQAAVNAELETTVGNLNEVVVVGYGTAKRKDLTGSVGSVKSKDFNQGALASPDQLIQGKIAGVQITNNSGAPGGEVTVRIRGNSSIRTGNQPLVVVDGVPLDGRTSRPGLGGLSGGLADLPNSNPLSFINSADIASIDILKDASSAAIYGSRGANGVILVTTKRGQGGVPKVDFTVQAGVGKILKKLEVLDANTYRQGLQKYNATGNDFGSNVDALDAILRTAKYTNYNVSVSGGNENGRYRLSLGYSDNQGIVRKTGLKKYTASLNGAFKFLDSKRLGVDFNLITSHLLEQGSPISNNSGFEGSLIGQALQWNPTKPLKNANGSFNIFDVGFTQGNYNPLALQSAFDDNSKSINVLANLQPYFKITNDLEYRMLLGLNYSSSNRRAQIASWMNLQDIYNRGFAFYGTGELTTRQITHTLNYNKQVSKNVTFGATVGFEYQKITNKGVNLRGQDFPSNAIAYTNYLQASSQSSRSFGSFEDPSVELQSLFGRATVSLLDKYNFQAIIRRDGSSKFGSNNKYANFPAFGFGWNISNEDFLKGNKNINSLKLRLNWGQTGNQEFPAGSAIDRFAYTGPSAVSQENVGNPDLKWETTTTTGVGLDFGLFNNKLTGSIDYFNKKTTDLLFQFEVIRPGPPARYWDNLPGEVTNSGFEVTLNYNILNKDDLKIDLGVNASFLKNNLSGYNGPTIRTGEINGQGLTGARAQLFANGHPLSTFYVGRFLGIDKTTGGALFEGGDANANRFFVESANPTTLLGGNLSVQYKKVTLSTNFNANFGHYIYNNTVQAALTINNIANNRNVAKSVYDYAVANGEAAGNSVPVSDRYLEKGNFLKLTNATLNYNVGNIGKLFRGVNISLTGQNLFVITKYTGFDPEVNTPKTVDGVPSFGIEYTPYPTARTFILGVNFSL
jgi:TonB-dependent starch-binding outer membrane protein SusC